MGFGTPDPTLADIHWRIGPHGDRMLVDVATDRGLIHIQIAGVMQLTEADFVL